MESFFTAFLLAQGWNRANVVVNTVTSQEIPGFDSGFGRGASCVELVLHYVGSPPGALASSYIPKTNS